MSSALSRSSLILDGGTCTQSFSLIAFTIARLHVIEKAASKNQSATSSSHRYQRCAPNLQQATLDNVGFVFLYWLSHRENKISLRGAEVGNGAVNQALM